VRDVAPDALILGNIGIAQVKQYPAKRIREAVESVGADALCVHLNPAQEAFQRDGDTDFAGCREALGSLCSEIGMPVIAKEVGNGISTETALELKSAGISLADVAGTGGTSWVAVEGFRSGNPLAKEFFGWGVPTAVSILETQSAGLDVIASGGVRSGTDAAKCLALGASACGMALPVLRAYSGGGKAGAKQYIEGVISGLKLAMFLTNSSRTEELGREDIVITGKTSEWMLARGLK
jgi:isopentenyl-diphosphate delta-isomerase